MWDTQTIKEVNIRALMLPGAFVYVLERYPEYVFLFCSDIYFNFYTPFHLWPNPLWLSIHVHFFFFFLIRVDGKSLQQIYKVIIKIQ